MKSGRWTFLFVSSDSKRDYSIQIPPFIPVLILLLGIISSVGLFNGLRFGIRYTYANFGLRKQLKINHKTMLKVQFLKKLVEKNKNDIEKLVSFESSVRLKYGMNSISEDVRKAGVGGPPSAEELLIASIEDPEIKKAVTIEKDIISLINQADLLRVTFSKTNKHTKRMNDLHSQRPSIWPARGRITSGFGYRFHPFFRISMFHDGIDIANIQWSPIISTAAGIVTFVGRKQELGNVVTLTHESSGYRTRYAHLVQPAVVEGQVVNRGELIGYMGNTGRSTGPHLHYEVVKNGKLINPMQCILPLNVVVD